MEMSQVEKGQKVKHTGDVIRNGIVKSISEVTHGSVFVVFDCQGNWDRYQEYTPELVRASDIELNWGVENADN